MKNKIVRTFPAVTPNAGVEAWYAKQLGLYVRRMGQTVSKVVKTYYDRLNLAQDAAGPTQIAKELQRQTLEWQAIFNRLAKDIAKEMANRVMQHADRKLQSSLRTAGFNVRFTLTDAMKEAHAAVVQEQVGLIRSIPQKYLTEVQTLVMQSAARGRDVGTLSTQLRETYGVTHRRANTIARDQNNKATATMTRARQLAMGMKRGKWRHSHAGKTPRPSHLKANGKMFDIKKGMLIDGKYILPGEEINCRCTWEPEIPGFEA